MTNRPRMENMKKKQQQHSWSLKITKLETVNVFFLNNWYIV